MTTSLWVAVAVVLTAIVLWAYYTAQRLNLLHIRTDAALARLQAMLDRRAAVVAVLIPSLALQAQAVEEMGLKPGKLGPRSDRERDLNESLAAWMGHHSGEIPPQLVEAETRVQLAWRFYNEAVSDTRALRLRPTVRMFRLGGTAPLPEYFEYSSGLAE